MKNTNKTTRKTSRARKTLTASVAALMLATTVSSIGASADNTTVSDSSVKASGSSVCAAMAGGGIGTKGRGGILVYEKPDWRKMKPGEERYDRDTNISGDREYWRQKEIREKYGWKLDLIDKMRNTNKKVSIENWGFFHAKNVKLYGRKAIGVDENGNYILGKWEQLNKKTSIHGSVINNFEITGDYFSFAFSYDITWGTDFPFSRVFLDENCKDFATEWDGLQIQMWGAVRTACLDINLGDHAYLSETNCSSHSEWKP